MKTLKNIRVPLGEPSCTPIWGQARNIIRIFA